MQPRTLAAAFSFLALLATWPALLASAAPEFRCDTIPVYALGPSERIESYLTVPEDPSVRRRLDVLVLYSDEWKTHPTLPEHARTMVREANQTYARTRTTISLRFVGAVHVEKPSHIPITSADRVNELLHWMSANESVRALRAEYGADVVTWLHTNGNSRWNTPGAIEGAAYQLTSGASPTAFGQRWTYSWVYGRDAGHVLAHEIGHNLGLDHGLHVGDPYKRFGVPHGTVMSTTTAALSVFSSSEERYQGRVIGSADRDSTRALRYVSRSAESWLRTRHTSVTQLHDRFDVSVTFTAPKTGLVKEARELAADLGPAARDARLYWFFGANNPEMLLKVLNGCGGQWLLVGLRRCGDRAQCDGHHRLAHGETLLDD